MLRRKIEQQYFSPSPPASPLDVLNGIIAGALWWTDWEWLEIVQRAMGWLPCDEPHDLETSQWRGLGLTLGCCCAIVVGVGISLYGVFGPSNQLNQFGAFFHLDPYQQTGH
jgi:hypothetical protein